MIGTLSLYSRLPDAKRGARVMLLKDLWKEAPLAAFGLDYPANGLAVFAVIALARH